MKDMIFLGRFVSAGFLFSARANDQLPMVGCCKHHGWLFIGNKVEAFCKVLFGLVVVD